MLKHAALALALVGSLSCAGCSGSTESSSADGTGAAASGGSGGSASGGTGSQSTDSGLVVSITTSPPKLETIDALEIEVSSLGTLIFKNMFELGEGGLELPGALTIRPPEDASAPVSINVIGWYQDEPRILRRIETTIPTRLARVLMILDSSCDGQLEVEASGAITSTCPEGESCVAGGCSPDVVDSTMALDFTKGGSLGDGMTIPPGEISF